MKNLTHTIRNYVKHKVYNNMDDDIPNNIWFHVKYKLGNPTWVFIGRHIDDQCFSTRNTEGISRPKNQI